MYPSNCLPRIIQSVTLRLKSVQGEDRVPPACGGGDITPEEEDAIYSSVENALPEEDGGVMEMTTSALLEMEDGRVTIRYEESELTGMEGTTTEITFLESEPSLVTVQRTGSVRCALVLEAGKTHTGAYETPISAPPRIN